MLLRVGDDSADVGKMQQALVECGLSIDPGELAAARFGQSTYNAVRQFQASHIDSSGHALGEDGVIGPETRWALTNPSRSVRGSRYTAPGWRCSPSEARADLVPVLQWAAGMIGTEEEPPGSNRGPLIDQWARAAGLDPGVPWCALFVSAAYHQLATGSPFDWKASALKLKEWGESRGRIVAASDDLQLGDVWVILRADFHGHAGIVGGTVDGRVATIEGNASDAVRGLVRDRASFATVIRPLA